MCKIIFPFEIKDVPQDQLESAYVGIFIQQKTTEHFKDENIFIDAVNTSLLAMLTTELEIRDISISKLQNRAYYIMSVNKILKK